MQETISYNLARGDPLFAYADGLRAARLQAQNQIKDYLSAQDVCDLVAQVGPYLHQQLCYPAFAGGRSLQNSLFPTVGTTGGFRVALRAIKKLFDETYRVADKKMVPVFVAPVPTYGNFLDGAADLGFEVVTVKRRAHEDWVLAPPDLADTFASIATKPHRRAMVFFDSSPHNPTGLIRGPEETAAQAKVLQTALRLQTKADFDLYRQSGRLVEPLSGFWILDDIVYHGTEYGDKKTRLFVTNPSLQGHCLTLLGPSKIGLAGLRAGLLVTPSGGSHAANSIRYAVHRHLFLEQGYPSVDALQSLLFCYSTAAKNQTALRKHLTKLNAAHKESGLLFKALVNGLETLDLSPGDQNKLMILAAKEGRMSMEAARALMAQPLSHMRVVTSPESGFFHLVNFQGLKGRYIDGRLAVMSMWDEPEKIKSAHCLGRVLSRCGIEVGKPSYYGLDKTSFVLRVSYAFPPKDILAIASRLRFVDEMAQTTPTRASAVFEAGQQKWQAFMPR